MIPLLTDLSSKPVPFPATVVRARSLTSSSSDPLTFPLLGVPPVMSVATRLWFVRRLRFPFRPPEESS